jgi:hypothetical protein
MLNDLTRIFENLTIEKGKTSAKKKESAKKTAYWFNEKCKEYYPDITDEEIIEKARFAIINIEIIKKYVPKKKIKEDDTDKKAVIVEPEIIKYKRNTLKNIQNQLNHLFYTSNEIRSYSTLSDEFLEKSFPNWTKKERNSVIRIYENYFRLLINQDENAAYDRLVEGYTRIPKQAINDINPGYFIRMMKDLWSINVLEDEFKEDANIKKAQKKWNSLLDGIADGAYDSTQKSAFTNIENLNGLPELSDEMHEDFDTKDHVEKIRDFARKVYSSSSIRLSPQEQQYFELLIDSSYFEEDTPEERISFNALVQERWRELGYNDDYGRKLLSRLRAKLQSVPGLKEGLHFITLDTDNTEGIEALDFLLANIYIKTNSNKLVAYQFSPEELEKMLELKKILQNEDKNDAKKPNFKFEIDRFPKVYFKNKLEDFNEALINELQTKNFDEKNSDEKNSDEKNSDEKNSDEEERKIRYVKFIKIELPNNIKNKIANHETLTDDEKKDLFDLDEYVKHPNFNIDSLGSYNLFGGAKSEGEIILYKDVIEAYVKNHDNIDEKDVRLIVLMHELGHWVSHWPIANNVNWRIGYNTGHKKTHEAIAQTIAYWMIKGDENLEKAFELMNPTKKDSPYLLYENLISQDISEILNKIVDLRNHHYLNDSAQYRYLADSSLNYIDNPMLMHLKTCLIFNDSLEAISDYTFGPETIKLIQDEIKKELKEGVRKEDLDSLKECLNDLNISEKEELIFTGEYDNIAFEKSKDKTLYKLIVLNLNPVEDEDKKYVVWKYEGDKVLKFNKETVELFSDWEDYKNVEDKSNFRAHVKFKDQAKLIYKYIYGNDDTAELSSDMGNLGF